MSPEAAVRAFHERFGLDVREEPIDFSFESDDHEALFDLRMTLMREEWRELLEAFESEDLVAFADACCDLMYVVVGTCVSFGIPFDRCFEEVQRSNMSKANADGSINKRSDGKILKSKQWSPPDLRRIIYGS